MPGEVLAFSQSRTRGSCIAPSLVTLVLPDIEILTWVFKLYITLYWKHQQIHPKTVFLWYSAATYKTQPVDIRVEFHLLKISLFSAENFSKIMQFYFSETYQRLIFHTLEQLWSKNRDFYRTSHWVPKVISQS